MSNKAEEKVIDTSTLSVPEANKAEKSVEPQKPKKRKRRFGDRSDGRRLRSLDGLHVAVPFIMKDRNDACNTFADEVNVTKAELFVQEQIKSGKENFSILHVILAAYVRTIAAHPYLNRFISGQRIYARNCIEIVMTIKKEMTLDAPETAIKVKFEPTDTIFDVYDKFNAAVVASNSSLDTENSTDKISKFFRKFPRFLFRAVVKIIGWLDYWGICPKALMDGLPFWGSMIITSMGSLGIKPIYHHLYNFGNLSVFISYGTKRKVIIKDKQGNETINKMIDLKVVTDERTCDGFQYATAFKCWKKLIENPDFLTSPPETVKEDVD